MNFAFPLFWSLCKRSVDGLKLHSGTGGEYFTHVSAWQSPTAPPTTTTTHPTPTKVHNSFVLCQRLGRFTTNKKPPSQKRRSIMAVPVLRASLKTARTGASTPSAPSCHKIVLSYCDKMASSAGLRDFLTYSVADFARAHPSVEFVVQPNPHKQPLVRGLYGELRRSLPSSTLVPHLCFPPFHSSQWQRQGRLRARTQTSPDS